MATEIERKFLVKDTTFLANMSGVFYRQGYLALGAKLTVRVRAHMHTNGQQAFLTVKGPTVGMRRAEYEYEIPTTDAHEMLDTLCHRPLIEKTRYVIPHGNLKWEVDVFAGANAGLVVAEIELPSEDTPITLPNWIGAEVTGDKRYFNAYLVDHPYTTWIRET